MSAVVNTAMSGITVKYGDVQFGGTDAPVLVTIGGVPVQTRGLPPMYALRGSFRYDESDRDIIGVDYVLTVRVIIFDAQPTVASSPPSGSVIQAIRQNLSRPGQNLRLIGIGNHFGVVGGGISPIQLTFDHEYGPKPLSLSMEPVGGARAWELTWEVSFFISECFLESGPYSQYQGRLFLATNFTATWSNDFEGLPTRTIQGYFQIAQPIGVLRNQFPADHFRNSYQVVIPQGFRRVQNTWRENAAKNRLDFSIVDEALPGDHLPPGITIGSGNFGIHAQAGEKNVGLNQAVAALQMVLKVAPNQDPSLAAFYFMTVMLAKQTKLCAFDAQGEARHTVLPIQFSIDGSYFDDQRMVRCSVAWVVTNAVTNLGVQENQETVDATFAGLNGLVNAAEVFKPVSTVLEEALGGGNYDNQKWMQSMGPLWRNRGALNLEQDTDDAVRFNRCDRPEFVSIGNISRDPLQFTSSNLPTLGCPPIPEKGGYVHYKRVIKTKTDEYQTNHRQALPYIPPSSLSQSGQRDPQTEPKTLIATGGPAIENKPEHITEYHGRPTQYIAVSVSALRFKNKPYFQKLKSVQGIPVKRIDSKNLEPEHVFDSFSCPVYRLQGWVIYEILGNPSQFQIPGQPLESDLAWNEAEIEL